MPMPLASSVLTKLDQGAFRKAILIELNSSAGALRMWSEPDDASIDVGGGAVTWEGSHAWVGFDPLEQTVDGALTDFSVTLGGLDESLITSILNDDWQQHKGRMYLALLDMFTGGIVDTPTLLVERDQIVGDYVRDGRTASVEIRLVDRLARRLRAGHTVFADGPQRDFAFNEAGGATDDCAEDVGVQIGKDTFFPGPQWRDRRSR